MPEGLLQEKDMPQYLVAIQHPNNYDPALEGEAMVHDIMCLTKRWMPPAPGSSLAA
jgi:hypothetical protein